MKQIYALDLGIPVLDDSTYEKVSQYTWFLKEDGRQFATIVNGREILMTQLLNDEYGNEPRD